MVDGVAILRTWLLAETGVTALVGEDIFGEVLPEHYDPTSNEAVVISLKGGQGHAEIRKVREAELQVRCWAGINQFVQAAAVYAAIYDAIHSTSMQVFSEGTVLTCYEMSAGHSVVDNDTGWATVVGAFHLKLRDDS